MCGHSPTNNKERVMKILMVILMAFGLFACMDSSAPQHDVSTDVSELKLTAGADLEQAAVDAVADAWAKLDPDTISSLPIGEVDLRAGETRCSTQIQGCVIVTCCCEAPPWGMSEPYCYCTIIRDRFCDWGPTQDL
jgi:hypothetical protein